MTSEQRMEMIRNVRGESEQNTRAFGRKYGQSHADYKDEPQGYGIFKIKLFISVFLLAGFFYLYKTDGKVLNYDAKQVLNVIQETVSIEDAGQKIKETLKIK